MTSSGIESYSTTASENVSANTSINWDEGMGPGQVNNSSRANMADTRSRQNDLVWFEYGIGSKYVAHTYASSTSTTLAGTDVTAAWHAGRRVKAVGSSTGTIYGTVSSSSFSTNTTVNYSWDSGSLTNETLKIYLSQIPVTGSPRPSIGFLTPEGTVASATTTDLSTSSHLRQNITGTTTITSFGTGANLLRVLRFSGILTLTHNASSLILPGAANITTAAGDIALATSDGSGNWRVLDYTVAAISPPTSGTFTPIDSSGASLSLTSGVGYYRKVGNTVHVWGSVTYPVTANGNAIAIGGLPFTVANVVTNSTSAKGTLVFSGGGGNAGKLPYDIGANRNATTLACRYQGGVSFTNADFSTWTVEFAVTYPI